MCHGADLGNAIEGWKRRPTDESDARDAGRADRGVWEQGERNDERAREEVKVRESRRVAAGPVTARVARGGGPGWCGGGDEGRR